MPYQLEQNDSGIDKASYFSIFKYFLFVFRVSP